METVVVAHNMEGGFGWFPVCGNYNLGWFGDLLRGAAPDSAPNPADEAVRSGGLCIISSSPSSQAAVAKNEKTPEALGGISWQI